MSQSKRQQQDQRQQQVLLQVENVTKLFNVQSSGTGFGRDKIATTTIVRAVDSVSIEINRGEHLSIVGESGSGKTTLARMILGLERPTSGKIIFRGTDFARAKERELRPLRKSIQIVFQDPYSSLNPRMSVRETVERPLKILLQMGESERRERVASILRQVGLADYQDRIPSELSGGQRQRVAIARAISINPELIVLDEPTSALDVSIQAQVVSLLKEIESKFEITFILITHNMALIPYLTKKTAVMYSGKIVEVGNTEDILSRPEHPYTKHLVASIPIPDPSVRSRQQEGEEVEDSKREEYSSQFYGKIAERMTREGEVGLKMDRKTPVIGCRYFGRCSYANERCAKEEPALYDIGEQRSVACFLFENQGKGNLEKVGYTLESPRTP